MQCFLFGAANSGRRTLLQLFNTPQQQLTAELHSHEQNKHHIANGITLGTNIQICNFSNHLFTGYATCMNTYDAYILLVDASTFWVSQNVVQQQLEYFSMLRAPQLLILLNKMDLIANVDAFLTLFANFCKHTGLQAPTMVNFANFKPSKNPATSYTTTIVPISLKNDTNAKIKLEQAFLQLTSATQIASNMPFRLHVADVYKIAGIGTVPTGTVLQGSLTGGAMVQFCPANITAMVHSVETHLDELVATVNQNIGFNVRKVSVKDLKRGYLVHKQSELPVPCTNITFFAILHVYMGTIIEGDKYSCTIGEICSAVVSRIVCFFDRRTLCQSSKQAKNARTNDTILVQITTSQPVSFDPACVSLQTSRLMIRNNIGQENKAFGNIIGVTCPILKPNTEWRCRLLQIIAFGDVKIVHNG